MFNLLATVLVAAPIATHSVDCVAVAHKPAQDVEYQEGEDSKGYAVAPADIVPPVLSKEDFQKVPLPLNIPLRNYPAQQADSEKKENPRTNPDRSESWIQPGSLEVDTEQGKVTLNGRDLTPPEAVELNPECWEQ